MTDDLRRRLEEKSTEELLDIVRDRDEDAWRPEVFVIAESILRARGEEVPAAAPRGEAAVSEGEPVEVCALTDPSLLPIAKSLLEEAGIDYVVRNEETQNLFGWGQAIAGFNPVVGPPVIVVPSSRLDEARELLTPLTEGSAPVEGDGD